MHRVLERQALRVGWIHPDCLTPVRRYSEQSDALLKVKKDRQQHWVVRDEADATMHPLLLLPLQRARILPSYGSQP